MEKIIKNKQYTTRVENKYSEYDNFICIPMTIDKKPIVSWKGLTKTPLKSFLPEHNIAILTGKLNQITVIDIDNPKPGKKESDGMKMYEELLDKYNNGNELVTPTCKTQSGGLHIYFKYDESIKTTTGVNGYSIDIRNDGGLIICPPSIGQKGLYEWVKPSQTLVPSSVVKDQSLHNTELMEIPRWFKEWLMQKEKEKQQDNKKEKPIKDVFMSNKKIIFIYHEEDIIDLLNALPKKYLNEYSDWLTITSCLKSEGLKDLWELWSAKSTNNIDNNENIWINLQPKLNINYLSIIAKKENLKYDNIIKQTKKINFMTKQPDIIINQQYLNQEIFNNSRTQIVKSNCGTGKTTLSAEYIKDLIDGRGYKILSITVRVSLAYQQKKNFKDNKIDMDIYKELKDYNQTDKLIIQIDSIPKLDLMIWKNTIIYMDEISALFSYILTSTTLKDKRVDVLNHLIMLLSNASYILCTDADINDVVIAFFNKLKIKYHLVENTYKNIKNVRAVEYLDKQIIIEKMEKLIFDGKNIICCFDSKDEMDITVQRLKKFCEDNKLEKQLDNFLIYSSSDGDEKDFLQINDRWKNKNIFFTPKITIGVSFDNKIPRDVFLIARGNSINAFGYVQQISRCRNINKLHYYVAQKYQYIKFDSPSDVKDHYTELLKQYKGIYQNIKTDIHNDDINYDIDENIKLKQLADNHGTFLDCSAKEWKFLDTLFNEMFFIHEYFDHIIRSAPLEHLRWMLEDKGYIIWYNNLIIGEKDLVDVKKEIKDCKKILIDNKDEINHRALFNKESSLTDNEKKIREDAERRARYLNINFNKTNKEKYEKYLVDDKEFTHICTYKLLMDSDVKLNQKISDSLEKDYCIHNAKSILTKIKLIRQIEEILEIKTLQIDTNQDVKRFEEDVEVGDDIKNMIKSVFRSNRDLEDNGFKNWYYQLIQMYKNVLGCDIFNQTHTYRKGVHLVMYSNNDTIINQYKELFDMPINNMKLTKNIFNGNRIKIK
jgi:hypothetical protein